MDEMQEFFWDSVARELDALRKEIYPGPTPDTTRRQFFCNFCAMRAIRRTMALDLLFHVGLYAEAYPLVRSAYEDWLTTGYVLAGDGEERLGPLNFEVSKHDARVHDAYKNLCGAAAVKRYWPENMPQRVTQFIGKPKKDTIPRPDMEWKDMAKALGLEKLHPYVYTRLSDVSHGGSRGWDLVFEGGKARTPERNAEEEEPLAVWAFWFHLRVLTLAGHEYGVDLEEVSDAFIKGLKETGNSKSPTGCVIRKEVLMPTAPG